MKKIAKIAGSIVVYITIIILVLFSLLISISSITARANNGVPSVLGYSPFSILTNSMEPTLCEGDYILVEECDEKALKKGDIVTFFTIIDGYKVVNTHRVVNVYNDNGIVRYQTQGDNKETNPDPDETLLLSTDVIGKYTGIKFEKFGFVMQFLSGQLGFFLVILLPVLLFTIYQVYKLVSVILYNKKMELLASVEADKEAIIAEYLSTQKSNEVAQEEIQE